MSHSGASARLSYNPQSQSSDMDVKFKFQLQTLDATLKCRLQIQPSHAPPGSQPHDLKNILEPGTVIRMACWALGLLHEPWPFDPNCLLDLGSFMQMSSWTLAPRSERCN